MPKETMTPRERWLAVLTRQVPDRVPMDYWATPEATAKLIKHLGFSRRSERQLTADMHAFSPAEGESEAYDLLRQALRRLHIDFVVRVGPGYIGPPSEPGTDVFGCRHSTVDYGSGEYEEVVYHPLAEFNSVDEIESRYTWPRPDWWDYGGIPAQIKGWEDYPIQGGGPTT